MKTIKLIRLLLLLMMAAASFMLWPVSGKKSHPVNDYSNDEKSVRPAESMIWEYLPREF